MLSPEAGVAVQRGRSFVTMEDGGWGSGAILSDALFTNLPVGPVACARRGTRAFVGDGVGRQIIDLQGWLVGEVG